MLEYLLLTIALLALFLFYHIILKIYLAAWSFKRMDPTLKTYIAPFFGMLGVQKEHIAKYGDSQRFMKDMIKENPDQKAYMTNLGTKPFLILCDAQLVREVCLNPKKFRKFNLFKHSRHAYERGIFLAEDEQWSNIRGIIRHSFNHEQLKAMIPTMQSSIKSNYCALRKRIEEA